MAPLKLEMAITAFRGSAFGMICSFFVKSPLVGHSSRMVVSPASLHPLTSTKRWSLTANSTGVVSSGLSLGRWRSRTVCSKHSFRAAPRATGAPDAGAAKPRRTTCVNELRDRGVQTFGPNCPRSVSKTESLSACRSDAARQFSKLQDEVQLLGGLLRDLRPRGVLDGHATLRRLRSRFDS